MAEDDPPGHRDDPSEPKAPKRVGFIFDPRRSSVEEIAAAIHRAWAESNGSPEDEPSGGD